MSLACHLGLVALLANTVLGQGADFRVDLENGKTLVVADDFTSSLNIAGSFPDDLQASAEPTARRRKRRQISLPDNRPIVTELYASQHCHGLYLRWKRPPAPISGGAPYTNSEFKYYNVYRSTKYFTDISGMSPYASGKDVFELSNLENVWWLDQNPLPNDHVWYAVTMVTRDGQERKDITPAKAMYVGAFSGTGNLIPLTPDAIKGKTMHHSAIYNPHRNEYFVAWDVDTNVDGQPDRLYALRLSPTGAIVGRNVLDMTVNVRSGVQGWPSVAYNPKSNEYLVAFQVSTPVMFSGKFFTVSQRVRTIRTDRVTNPALLLKGTDTSTGRVIPTAVTKPYIIYNPATSGYVAACEMIGLDARHSIVLHFANAVANGLKAMFIFQNVDARQGKVFYDTKRNELFVVAQLPNKAINKQGDVVPKLAYTIVVTKRNATGAPLEAEPVIVQGGETSILDSSISGFYDAVRDRLMLFWSDDVNGKRVIKSSRVLLAGNNLRSVEFMNENERQVCPPVLGIQNPFAASFPATGGQMVIWERYLSGRWKLGGSLLREDAFSFQGRNQRKPFVVTNEKKDEVLVLWQEETSSRQTNLFARNIRAVTHKCVSCSAPYVCVREGTCLKPSKNPCQLNNGGCDHICLKTYTGSTCSCREGFKLGGDKKTCTAKARTTISHTLLVASLNMIWKTSTMSDSSVKISRFPITGQSIVAVYFDEKRKMVYWSDVDNNVIWRTKLDGTNSEMFIRNTRADGIFVDEIAGRVYWTDFLNKRIEAINTDKGNRRVLVSTGIDKPRAITSCKKAGLTYIYWTDWGTPGKIERIQLDRNLNHVTNRRVVVSYGLGWPNGLTADCYRNMLYWADAKYDKIEVSDLLGKGRRTLAGVTVNHPYAIALHGKSIFWTDWEGSVFKADKTTGLNKQIVLTTLQRPTGIYVLKSKIVSTISCPDPGKPRDGLRIGDKLMEGNVVDFKCNDNFKLIGSSRLTCQSDGKWSDRRPVCAEVTCPDPAKPLDGNRVVAGSSIGDGVIYSCNPGYKRIGKMVRRCLAGGKWEGVPPKCVALPVFSKVPQNQVVSIGKSAVLDCKASGGSNVKTKWLKDGYPFTAKDINTRIFVFATSIFIKEVRYSDAGVFTCQATNEAGSVKAQAKIRVLGKKIPQCGLPKFTTRQRITGGRLAGAGSHPWIAMLWRKNLKKVFCGGSLIAEKWVLTAAHCLAGGLYNLDNVQVKFGKTNSKIKEPHEQTRRIIRVVRHRNFNSETFDSDIALLELDSPVTITDYVIPICLPYDDSDFQLLKTGVKAMISGWGSKNARKEAKLKFSRKLQELEIPVVDRIG